MIHNNSCSNTNDIYIFYLCHDGKSKIYIGAGRYYRGAGRRSSRDTLPSCGLSTLPLLIAILHPIFFN